MNMQRHRAVVGRRTASPIGTALRVGSSPTANCYRKLTAEDRPRPTGKGGVDMAPALYWFRKHEDRRSTLGAVLSVLECDAEKHITERTYLAAREAFLRGSAGDNYQAAMQRILAADSHHKTKTEVKRDVSTGNTKGGATDKKSKPESSGKK